MIGFDAKSEEMRALGEAAANEMFVSSRIVTQARFVLLSQATR